MPCVIGPKQSSLLAVDRIICSPPEEMSLPWWPRPAVRGQALARTISTRFPLGESFLKGPPVSINPLLEIIFTGYKNEVWSPSNPVARRGISGARTLLAYYSASCLPVTVFSEGDIGTWDSASLLCMAVWYSTAWTWHSTTHVISAALVVSGLCLILCS